MAESLKDAMERVMVRLVGHDYFEEAGIVGMAILEIRRKDDLAAKFARLTETVANLAGRIEENSEAIATIQSLHIDPDFIEARRKVVELANQMVEDVERRRRRRVEELSREDPIDVPGTGKSGEPNAFDLEREAEQAELSPDGGDGWRTTMLEATRQAIRSGWEINEAGSLYLPGDKSDSWAAAWTLVELLKDSGIRIAVPHWLPRRLKEIEQEEAEEAKNPPVGKNDAGDAFINLEITARHEGFADLVRALDVCNQNNDLRLGSSVANPLCVIAREWLLYQGHEAPSDKKETSP